MDNETLQAMKELLEEQDQRQEQRLSKIIDEKLQPIKKDLTAVKQQVAKTGKQVDILYNWVDGLDLKVKSITDIMENIGQK